MKKTQERKSSMYIVVHKGLVNAPTTIIEFVPRYKFYEETLAEYIKEIEVFREKQERNATGTAKLKATLREAVTNATLNISRRMVAYATNVGDSELMDEIDYNESDLDKSADTTLRDKCQIVHDKALEKLEYFNEYGITKPMIESLQQDINKFKDHIPETRLKITNKKDATDELAKLFVKTDTHLKKLDKVLEMLRQDHYEFYRNYKNNRIVISAGHRQRAVRGNIKDSQGNPLANVTVNIAGTKNTFRTSKLGNFNIQELDPGIYSFTYTKNGYIQITQKVNINKGESTSINLVMETL